MKGVLTCGTSLILSHKPNNTVQYSLKHLITMGKTDQYKGSFASCQVELGLFGVPRVTWGLIIWVKHSGCWLPPACYWLLCYWFASLLCYWLLAGLWHFSDLDKNYWLAQAGSHRCLTPCLPERDQSAENIDKVCAMREIGELDPYDPG